METMDFVPTQPGTTAARSTALVTLIELPNRGPVPPGVVLVAPGSTWLLPPVADSAEAASRVVAAAIDVAGLGSADVWAYGLGAPYAYAAAAGVPARIRSIVVGGYGLGRSADARRAVARRSASADPAAAAMLRLLAGAAWRPDLAVISVPVTLYVGNLDPVSVLIAADSEALAAPLVTLAGLDHQAAAQSGPVVTALVGAHRSTCVEGPDATGT